MGSMPRYLWVELLMYLVFLLLGPWIVACLGTSDDNSEALTAANIWGLLTWHGIYIMDGQLVSTQDMVLIANIQMVGRPFLCFPTV